MTGWFSAAILAWPAGAQPGKKPGAQPSWARRWIGFGLASALAAALHPAHAQPVAPAAPEPFLGCTGCTTQRGDVLIGLSRRLPVEPQRRPELAQANALRNPNRIATGTVLRLPPRLLRRVAVAAQVASVSGQARSSAEGVHQAGQAGQAGHGGKVLAGAVALLAGAGSVQVDAGFGSVANAAGQAAPPVRRLPPPSVATLPVLQEGLVLRFDLPPVAGAAGYRARIAPGGDFDRAVSDSVGPSPALRIADLPDGDYTLRIRAIDAQGLEGRDAEHRFRLKARPEPPLPATPAPRAVLSGTAVDFSWAANPQAQSYRLRLLADAAEPPAGAGAGTEAAARPAPSAPAVLRDLAGLAGPGTRLEGLPPGRYLWQLASVRAGNDFGPWGDARPFELRQPPPAPQPLPPNIGDNGSTLDRERRRGQTFDLQVARDAAVTQTVFERTLSRPGAEIPSATGWPLPCRR